MLHRRLLLATLLAIAVATPPPAVGQIAADGGVRQGVPVPSVTMVGPVPIDPPEPAPLYLGRVGTLRFPAIDLARPVYRWGCRGGTLPNLVVRWDCAGTNNTYLLGHAWGVFWPLYDARRDGRLRVGQHLSLADSTGQTRRYELAWFRIVPATYVWHGRSGDEWAWNATSRRAVTLQTCWGANSAYRLIVRFYEDLD